MAREDWLSVNVQKSLCKKIDRLVKSQSKDFGVKFDSRSDFVEYAIVEQFKKMEVLVS